MVLPLILTATIAAALGLMWWHRTAERNCDELMYCRCEDCGQKIRYAPTKAGRPAGCPRCKRRWILPIRPESLHLDGPRVRVGDVRRRGVG